MPVTIKGKVWCENDREMVECPVCHKVDDVDSFDVLGADDGCVFCTNCHQQVDLT
jgi:hypothetical protein